MHIPRQFLWRLQSIAILAQLVTAWFMQRDGKAGIHRSNNILSGGARSLLHVHAAHSVCVCNGEMLFWTVVLSTAFAESIILILLRTSLPSFTRLDKWRGQ
jgi:hypothetical protein